MMGEMSAIALADLLEVSHTRLASAQLRASALP